MHLKKDRLTPKIRDTNWLFFLLLGMKYLSFLYLRWIINSEDIIYNILPVLVWGDKRSAPFIPFTLTDL